MSPWAVLWSMWDPAGHRGACFRARLTGVPEVWGCGQFVQSAKWLGLVDVEGAHIYRALAMPWCPERFTWIASFSPQKRREVCALIISILQEKWTFSVALAVAPTQPGCGAL